MVYAGISDSSIALTESDIYPKHPARWGKLLGYEISLMGNIETTVLEFFDIYGTDSAYFSREASSPDISSMTYRTIIDTTGFLSISHGVVRKKRLCAR